ncbi:TetR/AcrR family transcriptional regulator [Caloranaerobacter ferrireducens]|uniref:TetR/AcrR family transcriptional regulator n=1 Tax=Caloranaerobacter ferrireducens TaxID=1323370 RepID=UPI00084DE4B2|nr:TetR/AcrR family transcriptional regulator [Caloranaerobacter ferrireducens]
MSSKFERLPKEKKEKIINICIEEFAKNGYEKASTNKIVERAGISKGILFHYFGSKKKLFLYVFDYVLNDVEKKFDEYIKEENSGDVFDRVLKWSLMEIKFASEYPVVYNFLVKVFISPPEELEEEIKVRYYQKYNKYLKILMENIDTRKFRNDIDINKAIEILLFTLEGIIKRFTVMYKGREDEVIKDINKMMIEFEEYITILKLGFYNP